MLALFLVASISFAEVAPGVDVLRGAFVPGTQPDGNTIIFTTRDGLIVVDTGRHVEHTQRIVDFARAAKKPIVAIVNTHWHLDHTGGNVLLRHEFPNARIYASGAINDALKGFLANYHKQLLEQPPSDAYRAELALIDAGDKLAPDEVITGPRKLDRLQLQLEHNAATMGDVWLFDRKTGVLVSGDLVTLPAPFLDTACPAGWKESLDRIAKVKFKVLIPGHGAPMTRAQFESYRTAFNHLLACKEKQACIDGWMRDLGTLLPESEQKFTRTLMDHYVDLLKSGRLCS